MRFDLADDSTEGLEPVMFDLVEDSDGAQFPDSPQPVMFDLDDETADVVSVAGEPEAVSQPDVAESHDGQPAPAPMSEPDPLDHPAFSFDGTPGWFSADPDDLGDGDPLADAPSAPPAPEPASVPEPPAATSSTFMPDPAFSTDVDPGVGADPLIETETESDLADGADPDAGHDIPAAWYPDPDDPSRYRWWDGLDWTDYVSGEGS